MKKFLNKDHWPSVAMIAGAILVPIGLSISISTGIGVTFAGLELLIAGLLFK